MKIKIFILSLLTSNLIYASSRMVTEEVLNKSLTAIYQLINTAEIQADNYGSYSAVLAVRSTDLYKLNMTSLSQEHDILLALDRCLMMSHPNENNEIPSDKIQLLQKIKKTIEEITKEYAYLNWVSNFQGGNLRSVINPDISAGNLNNDHDLSLGAILVKTDRCNFQALATMMNSWRMPFSIPCMVGVNTNSGKSFIFSALDNY